MVQDRRSFLRLSAGVTFLAGSGLAVGVVAEEDGDEANAEDPIAWRYKGPHAIRNAIVGAGVLYTQTDGTLHAIDTSDGSPLWQRETPGATRGPLLDETRGYLGGTPIRGFDQETGDLHWESDLASPELAVGHDMVYTSSDGTIYALDPADGAIRWERACLEGEVDGEVVIAESPILGTSDGQSVYAYDSTVGQGGLIAVLDPETGESKATMSHEGPITDLIAGSGHIAIVPDHDTAYLYDLATQEVSSRNSNTMAHILETGVYVTVRRYGTLQVFDLEETAEQRWDSTTGHGVPAIVEDRLISAYGIDPLDPAGSDDEDRVLAYDLGTGEERWRHTFEESLWTGPETPIVADRDQAFVSRDGQLLAIELGA